ncbi:hypothetical protein GCM10018790_54290 [Kitasatospora xanthocidica]|nr:hypothetical protein GCM10018790_54290 [Kitasatospora xanthocidica]
MVAGAAAAGRAEAAIESAVRAATDAARVSGWRVLAGIGGFLGSVMADGFTGLDPSRRGNVTRPHLGAARGDTRQRAPSPPSCRRRWNCTSAWG